MTIPRRNSVPSLATLFLTRGRQGVQTGHYPPEPDGMRRSCNTFAMPPPTSRSITTSSR